VSTVLRILLRAPSEWDVALSPELAPLFVIDAAIVAASASLGPARSLLLSPGGAR